jgi:hypothetical protein
MEAISGDPTLISFYDAVGTVSTYNFYVPIPKLAYIFENNLSRKLGFSENSSERTALCIELKLLAIIRL